MMKFVINQIFPEREALGAIALDKILLDNTIDIVIFTKYA